MRRSSPISTLVSSASATKVKIEAKTNKPITSGDKWDEMLSA